MSESNKTLAGIDFEDFNFFPEEKKLQSSGTLAPPIRSVTPVSSGKIKDGEWVDVEEQSNPWVKYAESTSGSVYYYNIKTIQRIGNYTKVWSKVYKYNSDGYRISLREIHCASRLDRALMVVPYDKSGKIIDSYTYNDKFEPVVPDSAGEALLEKVCY